MYSISLFYQYEPSSYQSSLFSLASVPLGGGVLSSDVVTPILPTVGLIGMYTTYLDVHVQRKYLAKVGSVSSGPLSRASRFWPMLRTVPSLA